MTADEFCGGVNNYICAVLKRTNKVGRAEGVVNNKRQTVRMSDFCKLVNIRNITVWITQGFNIYRLCVRLDRCFYLFNVMDVNKGCFDSVKRQCVRKQICRAAIDGFLCDNMLSALCKSLNGVGDRCCARG